MEKNTEKLNTPSKIWSLLTLCDLTLKPAAPSGKAGAASLKLLSRAVEVGLRILFNDGTIPRV